MPNVSNKVLRIILGYTDYANRKVWNKKWIKENIKYVLIV
jgi:hypothetical protein